MNTLPNFPNKDIILFDGVCNFCNSSINLVIDNDPQKQFLFVSLQSEIAQQLLRRLNYKPLNISQLDTVMLISDNTVFIKSEAALLVASRLTGAWKWFKILRIFPIWLRDFFYDLIAKSRYRLFGKSDQCRIPTPEMRERFL
jgi:predicted DCC family thiol-disulfide oxidoreductase YuxK